VTDFGLVAEGIRNSVKFQVSYWDGAIIAAAERLKATTLYSEDLSHGQRCGDVTIVNPFIASSEP
jgi:predicted nucleic acid-binding protein